MIKIFIFFCYLKMSLAEYNMQLAGFKNYREKLENILITMDINKYPNITRSYIELHNDILDCEESMVRLMAEWFDKKNEMEALENKTKNMTI